MGRLKGKVAMITGGALGLGRATAIRMAEEGAAVAIADLLSDEANRLADQLVARGFEACAWRLDVAGEAEVEQVMRQAAQRFGRIDILVNNAGVAGANKPTDQLTEAEWDFVQAVNVKGVFFCTKHAIPHLRRAGGGSIVNLSSIYGLVSAPDLPPYHASKGAVRLMTKTDALLYAKDRIRVNSIHPGFIWTPMVEGYLADAGDGGADRSALDALHPLGHVGEPDDVAWGCVYLASDEARFVTGAELVIDGGYTAR
ncbi:SDR family NAD(P)-dependent oxidoreductase [Phenylobacterium sp.]|uniref:SDR family NAD(P)-dependent oxidoreductase n=1 Tax=Phenylobacterium sp. TaxID=1871053 RepID=UPI0025FC4C07|nr:glucose 1-dehydrogenase [Phenylobacterium sp.]MBX3485470.1 glucose 1-dehydrogenase [Phenylobacterium sp.]MCW5758796.1 glucose 1-dehydrogenase [Phenylobacterium sp.]